MADTLDLLRAALKAPGQHHEADLAAMQAALTVLDQLGEGTVEWGVQYEWKGRGQWCGPYIQQVVSEGTAHREAASRRLKRGVRNVEVVSRRRYVTDWQPVEPQP